MFSRIRAHPWYPYLLIVGLCLVAFGLLAPTLGFYWDDWPLVYIADKGSLGAFADFFSYNRPLAAWTYTLTFPILGTHPLAWQLFTLLLRGLTAITFWLALRALWPQRERPLLWAALLFVVYPTFFSQSMSVAFSQHFLTYWLFMLSMAAMLWAQRRPDWARGLTAVALIAQALHLFTMEYFVGLELLRPLALWLLAAENQGFSRSETLKRTWRRYWPYSLVLLTFLVWRLALVQIPADPNSLGLLDGLRLDPLAALRTLVQTVARDLMYMLASAWYETMQPALFDFQLPASVASLIIGLILGLGFYKLFDKTTPDAPGRAWPRRLAWAGALTLVLGLLPVWLIGRDPLEGLYADRFTLAAMPGAAMLWVTAIEGLLAHGRAKAAFMALLLALAVALHLRVGNEFRNEWTTEQRFFDQLALRAPGLQPGTALIMEGTVSDRVADYAAAAAINTFYPQTGRPGEDYWVFQFGRKVEYRVAQAEVGIDFDEELQSLSFHGSSLDGLALYNRPTEGGCLWVITPLDAVNNEFAESLRLLAPYTDTDAILPDAAPGYPTSVFDLPLEPYWCQYYERAALAAQLGDWDAVLQAGDEAAAQGFDPNQGREYLPFIQAQLALGGWGPAADLTIKAYAKSFTAQALMCAVWEDQAGAGAGDEGFAAAWDRVRSAVGCP